MMGLLHRNRRNQQLLTSHPQTYHLTSAAMDPLAPCIRHSHAQKTMPITRKNNNNNNNNSTATMGKCQWEFNGVLWELVGITIWLSLHSRGKPLFMEVLSWENHLFLWAIFHSYVSHNQRITTVQQQP